MFVIPAKYDDVLVDETNVASIDSALEFCKHRNDGELLMHELYRMKSRLNVEEKVMNSIKALEAMWGTTAPSELCQKLLKNVTRAVARNAYYGDRYCYDKFMSYEWNHIDVTFTKSIRDDEIVYRQCAGIGEWTSKVPRLIAETKSWDDVMKLSDSLKYGVVYAIAYNFFLCQCERTCYECGTPDTDDVEYAWHSTLHYDADSDTISDSASE